MAISRLQHDLTGETFGKLTVIEHLGNARYMCKCECGNTRVVRGWDLKNNKATACLECSAKRRIESKLDDITGQRFGKLVALKYLGHKKWLCRCDCGAEVEILSNNLKKENGTRSCKSCADLNKVVDITGQRFGKVVATEYLGKSRWRYRCDCGNYGEASQGNLTHGNVTQCMECRNSYRRTEDLTEKTFGSWEVLEYSGGDHCYYKCRCLNCGKIQDVPGYSLKTGHSKSCGCNQLIDLTGQKINEFTVLEYAGDYKWKCQCSCGKIKFIHGWELRTGNAKSCGCKKWQYTKSTMLNKYGEIAPLKIGNPRSKEQIKALESKEDLAEFIRKIGERPQTWKLADKLGIGISATLKAVHKFNLENLVEISPNVSKPEQDLCDYIISITNEEVIQSDRSVLRDKELDIYIPAKKIAIEFNGTYWHSDIYKSKNYHQDKTLRCARLGIRLVHIFEYEWIDTDKKVKLQNYLKDLLSDKKEIIYGRLTTVKTISQDTAKEFLDKYHLQGSTQASIRYGIYKDAELLGVLTLGKPRFNNNYEYEIIRICWKPGVVVVGGLEKLFKTFTSEYNPSSVITYSDIGKFTGNSYLKLGFKTDTNSLIAPNYVWVKPENNEVLHRYQTQKHKLLESGLGNQEQTENEIMENLGFLKIYDAGNIRMSYTA